MDRAAVSARLEGAERGNSRHYSNSGRHSACARNGNSNNNNKDDDNYLHNKQADRPSADASSVRAAGSADTPAADSPIETN